MPAIEVHVTNRGSEPFDFSPANIEAIADSTPVKIYSVEEYNLLVERNARADYAAVETREQGALIRSAWGNLGPGTTPTITAQIDAATERSEVRQKRMKLLAGIQEMLSSNTVAPGQTFGGVIRLRAAPLLSARRLRLRVLVGAEMHEAYFAINQ